MPIRTRYIRSLSLYQNNRNPLPVSRSRLPIFQWYRIDYPSILGPLRITTMKNALWPPYVVVRSNTTRMSPLRTLQLINTFVLFSYAYTDHFHSVPEKKKIRKIRSPTVPFVRESFGRSINFASMCTPLRNVYIRIVHYTLTISLYGFICTYVYVY